MHSDSVRFNSITLICFQMSVFWSLVLGIISGMYFFFPYRNVTKRGKIDSEMAFGVFRNIM